MSDAFRALGELATGTAKYAIGGVIARAVTLVSIPVYLHFLSAHDFGIQTIALLNEQVLVILSGTAITNAVGKYYSDARRVGTDDGTVIGSAAAGLAALGLALAIVWELAAVPVAVLTLDGSAASVLIVRLIGASFIASLFTNLALALWQLRREILLYSVLNVARYLAAFALSFLLLRWTGLGVVGIILGWTLTSMAVGAAALVWLVRTFSPRFDMTILKRLVAYGAPIVPAALLMLLLNGSDRYILRRFADLSAVGIYATAYAVAAAFNLLLVTPFKQAWTPLMWKMRESPEEASFHRRALRYYVAVMVVALVGTAVLSPVAMSLVAGGQPDFVAAAFAIPVICLGFVLFGSYDVLAVGYFFAARTIYYTITVAVAAGLDIALNLVLVPTAGLWGTAIAFAGSYLAFAALSGVFGSHFFPQAHDWRPIATAVGLGVGATGFFFWLRTIEAALALAGGLALVALMPVLFVFTGVLSRDEFSAIQLALSRLAGRRFPDLPRRFGSK